MVGRMVGGIKDLEVESEEDSSDEEEEMGDIPNKNQSKQQNKSGGVFSLFKLVVSFDSF